MVSFDAVTHHHLQPINHRGHSSLNAPLLGWNSGTPRSLGCAVVWATRQLGDRRLRDRISG